MIRARKLLVIGAAALSLAAGPAAQAQQGGANNRRSDSGCIRIVKALSWIASQISGNDDTCKVRRSEDSLSSRSEHGKSANSSRVSSSGSEQIH